MRHLPRLQWNREESLVFCIEHTTIIYAVTLVLSCVAIGAVIHALSDEQ